MEKSIIASLSLKAKLNLLFIYIYGKKHTIYKEKKIIHPTKLSKTMN